MTTTSSRETSVLMIISPRFFLFFAFVKSSNDIIGGKPTTEISKLYTCFDTSIEKLPFTSAKVPKIVSELSLALKITFAYPTGIVDLSLIVPVTVMF